ncbi:MAG TPA: YceI family protein [Terriglobales bacterium]|nr:YceI family protein [Terriglobales bacterium]
MKSLIKTHLRALGIVVMLSCLALGADRPIDVAHSMVRIHVGKSGLFSAAGHEHWVAAPIVEGNIAETEPQHIWFRVEAGKMNVEDDPKVSPADQAQVQETMQTKVLYSGDYPEISFRSTSIEKNKDGWLVQGDLTLHGQTHSVSAVVHKSQNAYVGRCQIKQTDFGIKPITVAGGTVKVKDELQVEFSIMLVPGP